MSEKVALTVEIESGRLDVIIADNTEISRSYAKTLIENGNVSVNGKIIKKGGEKIAVASHIIIDIPDPIEISAKPQDIPINIVYEDDYMVIVNKAQGMVTHPAVGTPDGTLVNALMFHTKLSGINGVIRPGIVHRLDKDTSGLLVVAKNDFAHTNLAEQIATKEAKRIYYALVDGNIKEDTGVIEQPIGRNPKDRKLMAVVQDGKPATTLFKVLERFGNYTFVEYELKTGRTHQIRVHSKFLHHPVVGDEQYGGSNKFGLSGQLLHAGKLVLTHPNTSERMTFEAPLPDYFQAVLAKLRKSII